MGVGEAGREPDALPYGRLHVAKHVITKGRHIDVSDHSIYCGQGLLKILALRISRHSRSSRPVTPTPSAPEAGPSSGLSVVRCPASSWAQVPASNSNQKRLIPGSTRGHPTWQHASVDLYEALYTTRAMRRVKPDPVPDDVQALILDAAIRAPSGGNTQSWRFLLVDDPQIKARVALYRKSLVELWQTAYKDRRVAAEADPGSATSARFFRMA